MAKSNKNVIRKPNEEGKFTTTHISILHDKRLTATACRILQSILSDSDTDFDVTQGLIMNRFGIGKKAVQNAFKNLEECGYLKRTETPWGRGYYYTLSEYGNLNNDKVKDEGVEFDTKAKKTFQEQLEKHLMSIAPMLEAERVQNEIIAIANKHQQDSNSDFYKFKKECDKYVKDLKQLVFKECMKITENLSEHYPKKTITQYRGWLEEEIYQKHNIVLDIDKKWSRIKQTNYKYKTDYETAEQDRLEEEWDDNH